MSVRDPKLLALGADHKDIPQAFQSAAQIGKKVQALLIQIVLFRVDVACDAGKDPAAQKEGGGLIVPAYQTDHHMAACPGQAVEGGKPVAVAVCVKEDKPPLLFVPVSGNYKGEKVGGLYRPEGIGLHAGKPPLGAGPVCCLGETEKQLLVSGCNGEIHR